ncbi:MAG: hypothetical protein AB7Q29_04485 [Vicinamibacterales bacterium]
MKPVLTLLLIGLLAGAASGCGDDAETPTSPTTSPVTETFSSNLDPRGAVWRVLLVRQSGVLVATLSSSSQPSANVGFAIGLGDSTNGCLVTRERLGPASAVPELSAEVDTGYYCVKIFDEGSLTSPMSFTITIVHP